MKTTVFVLALLAFGVCCFLYGNQRDITLLQAVHTHRPAKLQTGLVFLTNSTAYISFALVLAPLIPALRRRSAPTATGKGRRQQWNAAGASGEICRQQWKPALAESATLLAALLLITGIVQALKYIVGRPRPYEIYPFIQKLSDAGGGSFPSGHTADAFTVLAFFALGSYPRTGLLLLLLWAFAVGYSRMALGVHYGSDVCGAAFLGLLCSWVTRAIAARIKTHPRKNPSTQQSPL